MKCFFNFPYQFALTCSYSWVKERERGNVAPQYGSLVRDHDTVTLMTLTRTFQCRVQSANRLVIVSQTLSSPEVANIFGEKR